MSCVVDIRERFKEVPLLLEIPGKISELADIVFQLDNFLPLLALKALDDIGHLTLQRVFDLYRYVEAFRVEVEVLVNPRWG